MKKVEKVGSIYNDELQQEKSRAHVALAKAKQGEKGKVAVRVNRTTTILISPDKDPKKAVAKYLAAVEKTIKNGFV